MAKEHKNIGASVRTRLLQLAKTSGQSFDLVLTRLTLERLLFRPSQSPIADLLTCTLALVVLRGLPAEGGETVGADVGGGFPLPSGAGNDFQPHGARLQQVCLYARQEM
jgi:hypothetical protein